MYKIRASFGFNCHDIFQIISANKTYQEQAVGSKKGGVLASNNELTKGEENRKYRESRITMPGMILMHVST